MHQTEIQGPWTSLCRGSGSAGSGAEAAPVRSLSQASYSDRRGGGKGGRGGGWQGRMGVIRDVLFHSSSPPNPVHESAETLCFGT